jgi:hypothetical protein
MRRKTEFFPVKAQNQFEELSSFSSYLWNELTPRSHRRVSPELKESGLPNVSEILEADKQTCL